jgi:hypothetical protein
MSTSSAQLRRYVELLAYGLPDVLRIRAFGKRLRDGATTEPGKNVIAGDGLRVRRSELPAHPSPEVLQAHVPDYPSAASGTPL